MKTLRTIGLLASLLAVTAGAIGCNERGGGAGENEVRVEGVHGTGGTPQPTPRDSMLITGTGTIRHLDLEGGFWGIVSDDSTKYDPGELDPRFHQDGMRVRFDVRRIEGQMTIRQWGVVVTVVRLDPL